MSLVPRLPIKLPLDVIHTIATLADRADLPSFLLASRRMNELLTPVLYSTIDPEAWDNIGLCLRTLQAPPDSYACGRDLAGFVRTFVLRKPLTRLPWYIYKARLAEDVLRIVARMHNLRSFSSAVSLGEQSSEILYTLVSGTSPLLSAVELHVGYDAPLTPLKASAFQVSASLQSLKLQVPAPLSTEHTVFLQALLAACSHTLRSLTLEHCPKPEFWSSVLPRHARFSALQTLEIDGNALAHPSLAHAQGVRSLKITNPWSTAHAPPPDLFPNLRELSCPRQLVPSFLPERTEHRRPIETIQIDNVPLERSDNHYSERPPTCSDLLPALASLSNSAAPVTRLSFEVEWLTDRTLKLIRPHLRDLEYLAINVSWNMQWREAEVLPLLVTELVAYLPHLRTLLVAGGDGRWHSRLPLIPRLERIAQLLAFSRETIIPEVEKRAPSLQRIGFLHDGLDVLKKADGWHWTAAAAFGPDVGGLLYEVEIWWEGMEDVRLRPLQAADEHPGVGSENGTGSDLDSDSASDSKLEDTRFLPSEGQWESIIVA